MRSAERRAFIDLDEYTKRAQSGPCFICAIVDGTADHPNEIVYRDDFCVAFLNRYPTLRGYTLVAPLSHRIDVVRDFSEDEYGRLQATVRRIGLAVASVVPAERVYLMSLGSHQGNAHVHWHVAPLPPGVPYDEQQFNALMLEPAGYLDLTQEERSSLADAIRRNLDQLP